MIVEAPSVDGFVIVRHGETEWSSVGRHTGTTDVALTEAGTVEAMSVGAVLWDELGIDEPVAVFTSPRRRARDTARLALDTADPAIVTDSLAEVDYGDYEGLTAVEIAERNPAWNIWRDGCPGGESPTDVLDRVAGFVALAEAAAHGRPGGWVIAFTHGHFSRALVVSLLGFPLSAAGALINDTASTAVVRRRRGAYVLTAWNVRPQGAARRPH